MDAFQRLMDESHIIEAVRAPIYTAPKIDYSIWDVKYRGERKCDVARLERYVNAPMIVDDFGSDKLSRMRWVNSLEPELKKLHDASAIRLNHFCGIEILSEIIGKGYVGTNEEELRELLGYFSCPTKIEYEFIGNVGRKAVVNATKGNIRNLLDFLSEQRPR